MLGACASSSREITATEISPSAYKTYDCDELSLELAELNKQRTLVAETLDKKAREDGNRVLVAVFFGIGYPTGGNERQEALYARLEGEYDAILMAGYKKNCDFQARLVRVVKVSAQPDATDSTAVIEYYDEVEQEIDAGAYDKNLWARAFVEAEGDEAARRVRYIELRADQLYTENINPAPAVISRFYADAETEIDTGTYDKNLWARAFVEAEGDETKRRERYIELRADQLNTENSKSNPVKRSNTAGVAGNTSGITTRLEVVERPNNEFNLTGIYVTERSPNASLALQRKQTRMIWHFNHNDNQITGFDGSNKYRISGELQGDVIDYEIFPVGHSNAVLGYGQLRVKSDEGRLEGNWKAGTTHSESSWNLRRRENQGVELYTIETGLSQPFRIRESEKLFDLIFAPSGDQNIVFLIHGRGDDFEEEFYSSMTPYTEKSSNTRFVIIHWLSWGEYHVRPYRQARRSSMGLSDFLIAFNEYKSRKPEAVGKRNVTLLAHSMGNIPLKVLLEELYEEQALERGLLDSVLLSAADVPIAGHQMWVEKIDFADKIFIIQNREDLVLPLSTFVDKHKSEIQGPRLGSGLDEGITVSSRSLAGNAQYLDITHLDLGHRPFNMFSYRGEPQATRLFYLLLNGREIKFPDPSIGLYRKPAPIYVLDSSDPAAQPRSRNRKKELSVNR